MQSSQERLLISAVFLLSFALSALPATAIAAMGSLDGGFLGAGAQPTPSPTAKVERPLKPGAVKGLREGPSDLEGTAAKTYETVKSLTHLLKVTPQGSRRTRLLLNRAAAMNLYVRQTLLASNRLKASENERKWLQGAVRDATEALSSPHQEKDTTLRAHSILGISKLYLDEPREAREHFLKVLKINPIAENAGWIGLFLAEDYFEEGNFAEAAKYYRGFYPRMSAQQKEQALYKLAWCHINLNSEKKAEELFVYLIKNNAGSGAAKDSARDLAYLITHKKNPADAIRSTTAIFKKPEEKIEFLNHVRANLEAQEAVDLHAQVVEQLLKLETDSGKLLELLLANLRVTRRGYASRQHMAAFLKLVNYTNSVKLAPNGDEFVRVQPVVETELRTLMKAYLDSFAERAKTPENLSHEELGQAMKKQFEFFNKYFPESKLRPNIVNLWLDVCLNLKDWQCVGNVSEIVLSEKGVLATYVERAYVDQLAALEELRKTAKADTKAEIEAKRIERMKEFVKGFEKSPQWIRVARQYTLQLIAENKHADTVIWLDKIYQREPTPDAFFRLQWARFKGSEFDAVLGDSRWKAHGKAEERLVELWRESSLALAMASRKSGDGDAYRKNIRRFLELKPDAKKAQVGRLDYFQFLVEKENFAELTSELQTLPSEERQGKAFAGVLSRTWRADMEQGRFKEAQRLVAGKIESADPELTYMRLVSHLVAGDVPGPRLLGALNAAQREYVLGLLAIVKPAVVVGHFSRDPASSQAEKDILALAIRLANGDWEIRKTPRNVRLLGDGFAFKVPEAKGMLPSEKKIRAVRFPSPTLKPKTLAVRIQALVTDTRKIRESVSREIVGKPPEVQLRAIEAARDLEKKVAETLINSPVPPELEIKQIAEYQEALKSAAKEFEDQSVEFERVAVSAREAISKGKARRDERRIPTPPHGAWEWPRSLESDPSVKLVAAAAQSGNYLGAHALLDLLRSTKVKSDQDYFRIRTGLILATGVTEAHRMYLLSELEANKQDSLIEEWRKLAAEPKGEGAL